MLQCFRSVENQVIFLVEKDSGEPELQFCKAPVSHNMYPILSEKVNLKRNVSRTFCTPN